MLLPRQLQSAYFTAHNRLYPASITALDHARMWLANARRTALRSARKRAVESSFLCGQSVDDEWVRLLLVVFLRPELLRLLTCCSSYTQLLCLRYCVEISVLILVSLRAVGHVFPGLRLPILTAS